MKIRIRQRRLNQFLDVINADLKKMTDTDQYSLAARFRFSAPLPVFGKHQTAEQHWKSIIKMLPGVQETFRRTIEKIMKLRDGGPGYPLPSLKRFIEFRNGRFNVLHESETQPVSIGDPLISMLGYDIGELGELLDGVSQTAFRTCQNPKCQKMFLQVSNKPKLYCSSSCAFKFLSKERRDRLKKKVK